MTKEQLQSAFSEFSENHSTQQTVAFPILIGDTCTDHTETLNRVKASQKGITNWERIGPVEFISNSFYPKGFAGYPYSLCLTLIKNTQQKSEILEAHLIESPLSKINISDGHIPIYSYQARRYSVFGYFFTIAKTRPRTTGYRGKKGLDKKEFYITFDYGRVEQLNVNIESNREDLDMIAQLTVHSLIADVIHHSRQCKQCSTCLETIKNYYGIFIIEKAIAKITDMTKASELSLPTFITQNKAFIDFFMEVDEYQTKEALDAIYPIIQKGYNRGSNMAFRG
jgi:hypothetical protein